ncbi:hypothetical protein FDK21_19395 [Cohaesibacter sp. CAU 1516]|uniref:hypothetical protein n=1 Tax=Cohaesibacter sp. CAU 1516 TaxID=2576038 RepID=UPI0010FE5947|nr:hypothetical protein [Cohaesibacter sp. CAU 1516]TLP42680.1 hypothetical protein FDK21_19395 [Cohaesibacter sp. CAU 1516]
MFAALSGKRDADASIGMDKVTGLNDALTGKAAAGHSHNLADLADVDAAQAGEGYLLARQAGAWVPVSVNAVFGQFSVNINSVDGLADALNGKATSDHNHDARYVRADQANVISNPLTFADNVDLRLGSDGDLRFTFNGTNSYLQSFSNDLYIVNRAHGRETFIQGEKEDGTVRTAITIRDGHYPELLYDGVLKMAAYSGGVRAYGAMQVHEGGADRNVFHAGNVHANFDLTNGLFGGEVPTAYALKTELPSVPTGLVTGVRLSAESYVRAQSGGSSQWSPIPHDLHVPAGSLVTGSKSAFEYVSGANRNTHYQFYKYLQIQVDGAWVTISG